MTHFTHRSAGAYAQSECMGLVAGYPPPETGEGKGGGAGQGGRSIVQRTRGVSQCRVI